MEKRSVFKRYETNLFMKTNDLEKKLNEISEHISEDHLIETLYNVVKLGKGKERIENSYKNLKYNFENKEFKINLNDGNLMGGGNLKVFYKNKLVLSLDRMASLEKKENIPEVDGWGVIEYHPGDWEEKVKIILEEIARAKEKRKIELEEEAELKKYLVPEKVLKTVKEKYDIK